MPRISDPVVYIQQDRFSTGSSLGVNWQENGSGSLEIVGNRVRLSDTDVGVFGRAVMTSFDPLASFGTPTPLAKLEVLVQADIILPVVLPAATEELFAGVRLFGKASGSDESGFDYGFRIDGSGFQRISLRRINASGAVAATLFETGPLIAIPAGTPGRVKCYITAENTARITLRLEWFTQDVNYIIGTYYLNEDITSIDPYMGIVLYQDGPQATAQLTEFAELDNYGVLDARDIPYEPFNPQPVKTPEMPVPAAALKDTEHDPVDEGLPIEPTWVRPTAHSQPIREFVADAGYVQSSPKEKTGRRTYELSWGGITDAEYATLKTWVESKAEFTIHDFEVEDTYGEKVWVVFTGPLQEEFVAVGAWNVRGTAIEIIPNA